MCPLGVGCDRLYTLVYELIGDLEDGASVFNMINSVISSFLAVIFVFDMWIKTFFYKNWCQSAVRRRQAKTENVYCNFFFSLNTFTILHIAMSRLFFFIICYFSSWLLQFGLSFNDCTIIAVVRIFFVWKSWESVLCKTPKPLPSFYSIV